MQVSVETTTGLERKMTVQLPAERVESEMETRLRNLSKRVKIDGFRPGKVPMNVVKKHYGDDVQNEVVSELIQSTFYEAVVQEKLRPAGGPKIVPAEVSHGQPFEYTATFEVYPEITVADVNELKVTRAKAEIGDSDVDTMIDSLRKQRTTWEVVDRAAANDDQVLIDFVGSIDGEKFEGGEGSDAPLVLGSNSFIPGFEEQLVGAKGGDERTVEVNFPEDYQSKDLAGKAAQFAVTVKAVSEAKLPEIDEEFIKGFGVGDGTKEAFLTEIRTSMERELNQRLKQKNKDSVMDAIVAQNEVELPQALVEQEIDEMMQRAVKQMGSQGGQDLNLPRDIFADQAKRRVSLGLLLGEFIKKQELTVDAERVKKTIDEFAASYDKPEDVVSWYNSNKEQMAQVESMVLEDQVVDWVLDQADVTDKSTDYETIMKDAGQGGQ